MSNSRITPQNRLVTWSQVLEITNLSRSTIRRLVAANNFPPPLRLTARLVRWDSTALDAWLATRTATQAGV